MHSALLASSALIGLILLTHTTHGSAEGYTSPATRTSTASTSPLLEVQDARPLLSAARDRHVRRVLTGALTDVGLARLTTELRIAATPVGSPNSAMTSIRIGGKADVPLGLSGTTASGHALHVVLAVPTVGPDRWSLVGRDRAGGPVTVATARFAGGATVTVVDLGVPSGVHGLRLQFDAESSAALLCLFVVTA